MEQLAFDGVEEKPPVIDVDDVATRIAAAARPVERTEQTASERWFEELGGNYDPGATAKFHLALARETLKAAGARRHGR